MYRGRPGNGTAPAFCLLFLAVSLAGLAGAVEVLAAEPTGMGKIRPEGIAAFLREQAAAAAGVAAEPHFALVWVFLPADGVPAAVFGVFRASADRTDLAFLAGMARGAVIWRACAAVAACSAIARDASAAALATLAALIVATTSHSSITPLLYE